MKINFLKIQIPMLIFSAVLIGFSLYCIIFSRGFKFSTDFTGGIEINVTFSRSLSIESMLSVFKKENLQVDIQKILDKNSYFIRTGSREDAQQVSDRIKEIINVNFADYTPNYEKSSLVGAMMSRDNQKAALKIVIIALIAELIYLAFRFKFYYGFAAIVALIHDVIIMLGAVSFLGLEVDILTISAVLTILGYSVNDTIIIFDRVRENLHLKTAMNITGIFNLSINQMLKRTIFSSLTTLFVVFMLYFFSSGSLNNFSFALIVGMISGTYSTLYIAPPVVIMWNKFRSIS
ncbi:MAG: protein-export membrane protein SecF [Spirochaetes bacterium GWF1_41_5]|nr:MAG: protein-export membrane protein SecF [Spirochaetes bacterium GWF1_41_5]HBE03232.1 protein translocase subunit SecF [Spirochaetia bacterium]